MSYDFNGGSRIVGLFKVAGNHISYNVIPWKYLSAPM